MSAVMPIYRNTPRLLLGQFTCQFFFPTCMCLETKQISIISQTRGLFFNVYSKIYGAGMMVYHLKSSASFQEFLRSLIECKALATVAS